MATSRGIHRRLMMAVLGQPTAGGLDVFQHGLALGGGGGQISRQKAATRRNMRREERVTVQGPVKEQQPDGMSHRGQISPLVDKHIPAPGGVLVEGAFLFSFFSPKNKKISFGEK